MSRLGVAVLFVVLLATGAPAPTAFAAGRCATSGAAVEQRIAAFWQCVGALGSSDYLLAEDIGAWAQNVIDRDRTACIRVADFRASTAGMQGALESASAGVAPAAPKTLDVESRIAKFWGRVDLLGGSDSLAATDLGQWGLNVIDRDPSRRIRVDDFQRSTAGMQAAFDRAKTSAICTAATPTPSQRPVSTVAPAPSPAPTATVAPTTVPFSGGVIQTCVDSDFSGWSPDTLFELCNGQVWIQTGLTYRYHYAFRPSVTIIRNSTGGTMYVDGMDGSVGVTEVAFLRSCISGTFTGWDGATIFPLCNGQIWQQASYAYHYQYAYRPSVLIYQSPYGDAYYMIVGGDSTNALRVRRIR